MQNCCIYIANALEILQLYTNIDMDELIACEHLDMVI